MGVGRVRGFVRGVFWGGVSGIAGLAVVSQLAGSVALQAPIALQNTIGAAQPQSGTAQAGTGGASQDDDWDKIAPLPLPMQVAQAVTAPKAEESAAKPPAAATGPKVAEADPAGATAPMQPPEAAPLKDQLTEAPKPPQAMPPQAMAAADVTAQVVPVVTPIAPVVPARAPEKLPEVATEAAPAFAPAVEPVASVAVEPATPVAGGVAAAAQAPQVGVTDVGKTQAAGSDLSEGIDLSAKAPDAPQAGGQVAPVAAASATVPPVTPRDGAAAGETALTGAAQATVPSALASGVPLEQSETAGQVQVSQPVPLSAGGALQRHSRSFTNLEQKPLFTILLVDDGAEGVDRAGLAGQDVPLTIVIDAAKPDALAHAKIWRAGGQEVVLSGAGLPSGISGAAYGAALETLAADMPEAVALVDTDGRTFQNDLGLAAEIVPFLAKSGRGLVTLDQGANPADQSAKREGLPHGRIFRKLDADGEAAEVVARYLDRAAFKAAQEGRVAVLGHVRPETVAGIMQWAVEGRAASVALAPLSAVLVK